ncbi:MAG: 30S ribosomal protein S6 [Campylobacterales bacterium]|nr:30S ribosomal protein S6 [Campylobacterales bacterium]
MNCYETLFVTQPTLTDEETKAQIQKILDVIAAQNGEILVVDDMGTRKLAYEVKKHKRGYYTVVYYKAEGATIAEIERNLRINENIIKFLSVKYSNQKEVAHFNNLVASVGKKSEAPKESPAVEAPATQEEPVSESSVTVEKPADEEAQA